MQFFETHIADLMVLQPKVFGDARGYFFESYNKQAFADLGLHFEFIQDNEAKSSRGVLRGLHFQHPPFTQTKLLRVISGEILDVAVDLRRRSATYGEHFALHMTSENKKQLLVPKGFAHGYVVLSETALVAYKVDEKYQPESEDGISWNDSQLGIDWLLSPEEILLSEKDAKLGTLENFKTPFV